MARQLEHPLGATTTELDALAASSSVAAITEATRSARGHSEVRMFGDVDPAIQLRMELLARASASPDTALPFVIALLVEGDERREAIVEAINGNTPLREQWVRTWEALRR